ncbi:hypothetical protein [Haloarchaeobius sp. HRN-SO-5]|uniref:hypothetical protein n=1 Tax=Haloarchaeobius sp. HRN-SO-5 TaxID=3446118 RepID=UPI003EBB5216
MSDAEHDSATSSVVDSMFALAFGVLDALVFVVAFGVIGVLTVLRRPVVGPGLTRTDRGRGGRRRPGDGLQRVPVPA